MIEVNLLPGAGRGRRGRQGERPASRATWLSTARRWAPDGWVAGAAAAVAAALALCTFLVLSGRARGAEAGAALLLALQDSAQVGQRSAAWQEFTRQRDSVVARMAMVEELDARRYVWPRLLDEISAAVPAGVWLTRIAAVPGGGVPVRFQVEGNAPDNFTLTRFWNALEASFFIRDVQLVRTEHVGAPEARQGLAAAASQAAGAPMYGFMLEAIQEDPPAEIVDTAPLEPPAAPAPDEGAPGPDVAPAGESAT